MEVGLQVILCGLIRMLMCAIVARSSVFTYFMIRCCYPWAMHALGDNKLLHKPSYQPAWS